MQITIKNGVTIINTGDPTGGLKNQSGHVGVGYDAKGKVYIAKIHLSKKYHYLGRFKDIKDAIAIRKEAERQREKGTLLDWLATLPHKNKGRSAT